MNALGVRWQEMGFIPASHGGQGQIDSIYAMDFHYFYFVDTSECN